MISP
ncbi:hypothetical protein D021_1564A, partial [Vibrio parahaemolyticus 10296]|jgi:hypothetical protein